MISVSDPLGTGTLIPHPPITVSNSGNMKGFKWLKRLLEPMGYKMHYSELYSFAHFDSTVLPLRPGLVLFNGARLSEERYPPIFTNWDKVEEFANQIVILK